MTARTDPPGDAITFRPHDVAWDSERVGRFWDFMAQRGQGEYFSSKLTRALCDEVFRRVRPIGTVLDVGCGLGHLIAELDRRRVTVLGVDSSPESIASARTRLPHLDPNALRVGSLTAIPFQDASVDTVLLIEVVEHVLEDDLNQLFAEIGRVLRPGGHLFISTPNGEDLGREAVMCPDCGATFHRMQHIRSWTPRTMSGVLEAHSFRDIRAASGRLVEECGRIEQVLRSAYYRLRGDRPHLIVTAQRP